VKSYLRPFEVLEHWLRDKPHFWMLLATILFLTLMHSIIVNRFTLNHDCAVYIQAAQLILEGQLPYADFYEINPPLIMYLNVPHLLIGRWIGISPGLSFHLFVLVLVFVSTFELIWLLRSAAGPLTATMDWCIAGIVWILISIMIWQEQNFGQREHLFLLLYVPYLFLRWARRQEKIIPGWYAIVAGTKAGFGLFLKPHFLLLLIIGELGLLAVYRTGKLQGAREVWSVVCVGFLYLLHWFVLPHRMLAAFVQHVEFVSEFYRYYDASLETLLRSIRGKIFSLASIPIGLFLLLRFKSAVARLNGVIVLITIAALLIYVQQKKAWGYQLIPFAGLGLLSFYLSIIAIRQWLDSVDRRELFRGVRFLSITLLAFWFFDISTGIVFGYTYQPNRSTFSLYLSRETRPDDLVMIISTSVSPAYPHLVLAGRKPGSRYLWSYPIALFCNMQKSEDPYSYRTYEQASQNEQAFITRLVEDIRLKSPRLVIIPTPSRSQACPPDFNIKIYLERIGFLQAITKERYVPVDDYPGSLVFRKPN
jgi:hypothetical protein